jgi:ketosteroid isomerase-like protein
MSADEEVTPRGAGDVVRLAWRHWAARKKDAVLDLCSTSVVYALHVPKDVLPFGGVTVGKFALSERLQTMLEQFEVLQYDGEVLSEEAETARGIIRYRFRHRSTGAVTEGIMRQIVWVRDGLLTQIETFKDVDGTRASMGLVDQPED